MIIRLFLFIFDEALCIWFQENLSQSLVISGLKKYYLKAGAVFFIVIKLLNHDLSTFFYSIGICFL